MFLVVIVIIVIILVYKIPVEVHREFWGNTLSPASGNADKQVLISIEGYLHRNLFSEDGFSGSVVIDGKPMSIRTTIPANINMRISGIKDKLKGKPIFALATRVEAGSVKTIGQVILSRDFDMVWGYSSSMREQYKDNSVMFAGPTDSMSASEVMKILYLKQY